MPKTSSPCHNGTSPNRRLSWVPVGACGSKRVSLTLDVHRAYSANWPVIADLIQTLYLYASHGAPSSSLLIYCSMPCGEERPCSASRPDLGPGLHGVIPTVTVKWVKSENSILKQTREGKQKVNITLDSARLHFRIPSRTSESIDPRLNAISSVDMTILQHMCSQDDPDNDSRRPRPARIVKSRPSTKGKEPAVAPASGHEPEPSQVIKRSPLPQAPPPFPS